nr:MAG TPA: hypothetical protein [Caudoviricetes sp.]
MFKHVHMTSSFPTLIISLLHQFVQYPCYKKNKPPPQ